MGQGLNSVLHLFQRLVGSAGAAATDDHELLDSFVRQRDEKAFEELVRRHGPMVLGVCRRVLRDPHAADDAFQVTFLTLACKAPSLRRGQALPAWLHRVAYHVALRVQARARRAGEVEREAPLMSRPEPAAEVAWQELSAVLDEELQRLPDDLRAPVVLCGLEGKTHVEAARELGWPAGSLSKRLARGRELLRRRLARRGFELGGTAATAGLLGDASVSAAPLTVAVPEGLLSTTVRGAVKAAAGQMTELSAATAALLREVLGAMFRTRMKIGVVMLLVLALSAPLVGLGLFALGGTSQPTPLAAGPTRKDGAPRAGPADTGKGVVILGPKQFRFCSYLVNLAYSPNGKLLAVSDYDTIHLYDAVTKKELRSWDGPPGFGIRSLAFSPDSKVLATADQGPQLRQWDVATGKLLREFAGHPSGAYSIRFSPDGSLLATAGEDRDPMQRAGLLLSLYSVRLRDAKTGKESAVFKKAVIAENCVAFSPNGNFLAWCSIDGKVHVSTVRGGEEVFTQTEKTEPGRWPISALDFSRDSKVLAVGTAGVIKLFELASGKLRHTLAHKPKGGQPALQDGFRIRFAPDGKTLGSIGHGGVALWDVPSGKLKALLHEYGSPPPTDLCFQPDGKKLASNVSDQSVRFWGLATDTPDHEPGHTGPVRLVALSPDGSIVVTGSDDSIRFWDRATGKELRRLLKVPVVAFHYGRAGLLMLGSGKDYYLRLYDPATGKEGGPLAKDLLPGTCLALSADGKLLAVGQQTIRLIELPSGKEKVTLKGHDSFCICLAFGPGDKTLVSGGQDTVKPKQTYGVKLWNLGTGKELRTLETGLQHAVNRVAYSPDGRYVVTNLRMYDFGPPPLKDLAKGKVIDGGPPGVGSVNWPGNLMVFSPDGKLLAVGMESGQPKNKVWIDLWDTRTWEKTAVLEGHTQRILAMAFSTDGRFLVSGSMDNSARVWPVPQRKK